MVHRPVGAVAAHQAGAGRAFAAICRRGLLLAGGPAPRLGLFRPAWTHGMADTAGRCHRRRQHPGAAGAIPGDCGAPAMAGGTDHGTRIRRCPRLVNR